MSRTEDLLKGLNPEQAAAVSHGKGPLLVLSGAGSGKTRVLTHRLAWLVAQGVPEPAVVALTFTYKAATSGQTLTVTVTNIKDNVSGGNLALQAATLN